MTSTNDNSRRRRVTFTQLQTLWEFLNSHKELATGYNKSAQAREHSRQLWIQAAESLNSNGEGAVKDWKGWSNYWVDYKAKLKRKSAAVRTSHNRTGGGPSDIHLNYLEKKYLGLLGNGFGTGLPNTQVNPFPDSSSVSEIDAPLPAVSETPIYGLLVDSQPQPCVVTQQEEASITEMPQDCTSTPPTSNARVPAFHPVRRRRSRTNHMSVETARRTLVEISRERLEVEKSNNRILQEMLVVLNRIANNERSA